MKLFKQIIYKGYVVGLMAFTVWYGVFMYGLIFGFEGKEAAGESFAQLTGDGEDTRTEEEKMFTRLLAEQDVRSETNIGTRVIDQPFIEGRFHHVGFEVQRDRASMCVRCHGNVPHNESKELRSFLNMHAFYLACETCHATPDEGAPSWQFRWYDKDTGELVANPLALADIEDSYTEESDIHIYPTYGNYGAKVVPGSDESGEFKLLHGAEEFAFVTRYIGEQDLLVPEKKSQMETVIHRKVANEPVECSGCHTSENPYFSYAELGYPPSREQELTNTAVVGMISKYKEFYMPSFLHPGEERSKRDMHTSNARARWTKACAMIAMMLISHGVAADWALQQSPDGHWIVTRNDEGHQLIVGGKSKDLQFLVTLSTSGKGVTIPEEATISIDRGPRILTRLTILDRNPDGLIVRLDVKTANRGDLIMRMISGLNLKLHFSDKEADAARNVYFSLIGFTVVYNDLLIANAAGRLDPRWLAEQNRERELICYYVSDLKVRALRNRISGLTEEQSLKALPRSGLDPVDENLLDIVTWAHQLQLPLPVEPRAEKYGLYQQCMDGFSIEG